LPALRERREDIAVLTRHFLGVSALQLGIEPKRISDAALARLSTFSFPGNVRQLENICHWLTVMAPAQVIEPKDLPPEVLAASEDAAGGSVGPTTLMPVATVPVGHSGQPIAHKIMPANAPVDTGLPAIAGVDQGVNGIGWEHDLEG